MFRHLPLVTVSFLTLAVCSTALAAEKLASIIIDDVGNNYQYGKDVIKLPGALTIAILPETTFARDLARLATKNHKEVMLHLPMQSIEHHNHSPGTLNLHMTKSEFTAQLQHNLTSVPHIRGVNNHMGSLLTRHPGHMSWLMDALSRHGGLYFIDSRTSSKTVAEQIAVEYNIPNLRRDIFLDPDNEDTTLRRQFARFIKKVNQRGYALAIAHPYPKTIKFLQRHLQELKKQGIRLVPVSKLIHKANLANKNQENNHVACTGPACARL